MVHLWGDSELSSCLSPDALRRGALGMCDTLIGQLMEARRGDTLHALGAKTVDTQNKVLYMEELLKNPLAEELRLRWQLWSQIPYKVMGRPPRRRPPPCCPHPVARCRAPGGGVLLVFVFVKIQGTNGRKGLAQPGGSSTLYSTLQQITY